MLDNMSKGAQSELKIIYDSVRTARDASATAMANGQGVDSAAARPMVMSNGEHTSWLLNFFSQVARNAMAGRGSPFVHPRVLHEGDSLSQLLTSAGLTAGLELDGNSPVGNAARTTIACLKDIHNLTILSLKHLLLEKPTNKQDATVEGIVTRLFSSTRSLWSAPPIQLDERCAPWESWLVAESIRRSMFAAIMVRGIWYVMANGYCYYEPFFESLPFDPRAGIWEATCAEEWVTAVHTRGGAHTKLKSYHEFITMSGLNLDSEEDGKFQRMLFVAYHGNNGIKTLEKLDKNRDH